VLGCVALLAAPVWFGLKVVTEHRREEQAHIVQSMRNLHDISSMVMRRALQKGWPDLTGKAFVLYPLAAGLMDVGFAPALFISPADDERSKLRIRRQRWEEVTLAALRAGTDFGDLTSYAGPAEPITKDRLRGGPTPLLADLHVPDRAIVAFTTGEVRVLEREDLGLDDDDPIVAGPASRSPLLRKLSDR